jgi:hypothetical protein
MAFSRDKPAGVLPEAEGWVGVFDFGSECREVGICWDIMQEELCPSFVDSSLSWF